jgi:hypothetical protein
MYVPKRAPAGTNSEATKDEASSSLNPGFIAVVLAHFSFMAVGQFYHPILRGDDARDAVLLAQLQTLLNYH